jgi:hypothetical protein
VNDDLDQWQERLSEYLDGELGPDERAACEAHLAGCAECARLLDELRSLVAAARALPDRAPARDPWPALRAELESQGPRRTGRWPLALAAGVLVTLGAVLGHHLSRRASPAGPGRVARGESYLLLLHEPEGFGAGRGEAEHAAVVERYSRWARELGGRCAGGEELEVDGVELRPSPETAGEVLQAERGFVPGVGGFFLVQVEDRAEALELARTCPHLDQGGWIELRRIRENP